LDHIKRNHRDGNTHTFRMPFDINMIASSYQISCISWTTQDQICHLLPEEVRVRVQMNHFY